MDSITYEFPQIHISLLLETLHTVRKKVVEYETFKILKSKLNLITASEILQDMVVLYTVYENILWAENLLVEQNTRKRRRDRRLERTKETEA
jgi:hypothetical protein